MLERYPSEHVHERRLLAGQVIPQQHAIRHGSVDGFSDCFLSLVPLLNHRFERLFKSMYLGLHDTEHVVPVQALLLPDHVNNTFVPPPAGGRHHGWQPKKGRESCFLEPRSFERDKTTLTVQNLPWPQECVAPYGAPTS